MAGRGLPDPAAAGDAREHARLAHGAVREDGGCPPPWRGGALLLGFMCHRPAYWSHSVIGI